MLWAPARTLPGPLNSVHCTVYRVDQRRELPHEMDLLGLAWLDLAWLHDFFADLCGRQSNCVRDSLEEALVAKQQELMYATSNWRRKWLVVVHGQWPSAALCKRASVCPELGVNKLHARGDHLSTRFLRLNFGTHCDSSLSSYWPAQCCRRGRVPRRPARQC